jgi:TrkA domain protein
VATIEETPLPGIGSRLDFFNDEGRRMGVVRLHGGRRELFVCAPSDPDDTQFALRLSESDAITLVEALGVVTVEEDDSDRSYSVEGLVFEWLSVAPDSAAAGRTIAELRIRTRTGASVVAVLRPTGSVPAPEPSFRIEAGDTVVAAGTAAGVEAVQALLQSG